MVKEMYNKLLWNEKIRIFRVGNRWSQLLAGEKCFTSPKNYWEWETGKHYPRAENRKIIANAFGLKVEHIFSENDQDWTPY
ncbi:helix-turn-helix transcriptional regulator [Clostridium sp.]|uniref:helix-turn-helix transcriptional regulator n=1 Tax=Clostridium sp. TaxID=1506 RepID=UPI0025BBD163|nr:helix-turn-helix transcriptional regulator [Clostridium sp.]